MLTGDFVKEMREAIQAPLVVQPTGARPFVAAPSTWNTLDPPRPAVPTPVQVATLTGLSDYLKTNVDGLTDAEVVVHVEGPAIVRVLCKIEGEIDQFRRREMLRAVAPVPSFKFGEYLDSESFLIGLQTCFRQTPERDDLAALLGSIREAKVSESLDDGLTQEVKTSKGVALMANTKVPNPVELAPFRTFSEVEPPEVNFVLRLRGSEQADARPRCALFEADGGAWRIEAIKRVASWLRTELKTKTVAILS